MTKTLRPSGVDALGDVPWGTHVCQFYQSSEELLEILVGYFQQSLKVNERCVWITSPPLGVDDVRAALQGAVANLGEHILRGQIKILNYRQWYFSDGCFDTDRILRCWLAEEQAALASGYEGLRVAADTSWLKEDDWSSMVQYEARVNDAIVARRVLALCAYPLDRCQGVRMLDVLRNHPTALIKRDSSWEAISSPQLQQLEEALRTSIANHRYLFDRNLDAVFFGSPDGSVHDANPAACAMLCMSKEEICRAGRAGIFDPADPRLCSSLNERDRTGAVSAEITMIRRDGTKFPADISSVTVESDGGPPRTFTVARDISDRKQAEEILRDSQEQLSRLNRLYSALSEMNRVVIGIKSREELFCEICRIATEKAGFTMAWVGWIEAETQRVVPIASAGNGQGYLDEIQVYADDRPAGRGPTGSCIREGQVCVVHDFPNDPRMIPWRAAIAKFGFCTAAALPIRLRGNVVGALTAYARGPYLIQDKEIILLEEAAAAIALGLDGLEREAQRKLAEERLIASEASLRESQEIASIGSYVHDIRGGRWTSSAVLDRIFGISANFERSVEGWYALMHADDRQAMLDYLRDEVIGQRRAFDREYRIVRQNDKQVRWVHGLGRLEFDAVGRPMFMLGTIQDTTDRKRVEESLLRSEAGLTAAQRIAQLGSWEWDVANNTAEWSEETYRIFGTNPYDLAEPRQVCLDRVHPDDRPRVDKALSDALSGVKDYDLNYRIVLRDGSEKVIHAIGEVNRDSNGNVRSMRGTVHDITEGARAERRLRENEERFRALFEQSPDGIVIIDPSTARLVEFNEAAHNQLGYTREEFSQLTIMDLNSVESEQRTMDRLASILANGRIDFETCHTTKRGETRNVHVAVQKVEVSGRHVIQGVWRDVTDRNRMEAALRTSERRQAEAEKLAAAGRMAARIAHEINNPLAGIKNAYQLVRDAVPEDHPDRDMVERINREIDRISNIVRQMYSLYSPQADRMADVGIADVVYDVLAMIEPMRRQAEVRFDATAVDPALKVHAPIGGLNQIVYNLLANAVEASSPGGVVTVTAEVDATCSNKVRISVQDRGRGIASEIQDRIFEPFFTSRSDEHTREGLGLGLSVIKSVVEAAHGRISFESALGVGTTFHVLLPICDETQVN